MIRICAGNKRAFTFESAHTPLPGLEEQMHGSLGHFCTKLSSWPCWAERNAQKQETQWQLWFWHWLPAEPRGHRSHVPHKKYLSSRWDLQLHGPNRRHPMYYALSYCSKTFTCHVRTPIGLVFFLDLFWVQKIMGNANYFKKYVFRCDFFCTARNSSFIFHNLFQILWYLQQRPRRCPSCQLHHLLAVDGSVDTLLSIPTC